MLIILGKTCSGKDSVVDLLVKNYGYKKLTTYTTRPKRKGERDGVTYHFISEEDFQNKVEDGFFFEYKTYDSALGTWRYGSALTDYENADCKTVVILTPDGYRDFILGFKDVPYKAIYVHANNKTITERLLARGDNAAEAKRRVLNDNDDFKGLEMIVDKIVYNNANSDINSVAQKVAELGEIE